MTNPREAAVARGQRLFNSKPIRIAGVNGLNDDLGVPVLIGTCTTCHDTPHAGSHSIPAPLNIGLTDASRRTPDLPLYTLRNKLTSKTIETTDPGRALITGKWKDIGKVQRPGPSRARRKGAVLPQRVGERSRRGRRLLRPALRDRPHRRRERRPGRVPSSALTTAVRARRQ